MGAYEEMIRNTARARALVRCAGRPQVVSRGSFVAEALVHVFLDKLNLSFPKVDAEKRQRHKRSNYFEKREVTIIGTNRLNRPISSGPLKYNTRKDNAGACSIIMSAIGHSSDGIVDPGRATWTNPSREEGIVAASGSPLLRDRRRALHIYVEFHDAAIMRCPACQAVLYLACPDEIGG